jgi:hypothetical protein
VGIPVTHMSAPLTPGRRLGTGKALDTASGAWQKYAYNRTYGIIRAKNG